MKEITFERFSPFIQKVQWKRIFFFLFLAILGITFLGQIFRIEKILLFKEILIEKIEFGEKPGRFFFLFILPAVYLWKQKKTPFAWKDFTLLEKGSLLFLLYFLLAFIWIKYPKYHRRGLMQFLFCALVYLTARYFAREKEFFQKVLYALGCFAALLGLVNLWKYHIFHIPIH
ncbi:MAG: hypothetical protein D6785_14950, partial [Planctomycetota bacterium]